MTDRGAYRSIHCVIVDGPDFQALKPGAKLVWYTLKMTLGPSGIDVVPALVATLVERTGANEAQIKQALDQLQKDGWLQIERNVVWMVEGLRHEPAFSLSNQNHRAKIRAHLAGLPRLAIVDAFRAHYGFTVEPSEMASHAPNDGADIPSKMPSKMVSTIREEGRGKTEDGEGTPKKRAAAKRRVGKPTWLTPFADAWRTTNGGTMSAGKAVNALAKLIEEHGADEVLRRWVIYLAAKGEWASAPKFAETWGRWEQPPRPAATPVIGPAAGPSDAAADAAWEIVLSMVPAWNRREVNADTYQALPDGIRRGLSKIGGFRIIAETPDAKRVWLKRDFVDAFASPATPPHARSA